MARQVKFGAQVFSDEGLLMEDINLEFGRFGLSDISFSTKLANRVVHVLARKLKFYCSCGWGFPYLIGSCMRLC